MQKSRCNVDDVSNTQRFNSYTYANNNPMRFTDPTGYDGFDDVYLGSGMQAWNGIKPEQDGPGGGSGGFNSPINFWVKLSEVTITAYSPVWDNWKNWYRKNNDPYLIWGKNAGANAGGMFGSMSVSDTRRYWQNMSMGRGGKTGSGLIFGESIDINITNTFGLAGEIGWYMDNKGINGTQFISNGPTIGNEQSIGLNIMIIKPLNGFKFNDLSGRGFTFSVNLNIFSVSIFFNYGPDLLPTYLGIKFGIGYGKGFSLAPYSNTIFKNWINTDIHYENFHWH